MFRSRVLCFGHVSCASVTCLVLSQVFVLCIVLYSSISEAFLTFKKCSRPQQLTLCRSLHAVALQATASEGLAQGPYIYLTAREGFEPTTLRTKGDESTNEPPHPTDLATCPVFGHVLCSWNYNHYLSVKCNVVERNYNTCQVACSE